MIYVRAEIKNSSFWFLHKNLVKINSLFNFRTAYNDLIPPIILVYTQSKPMKETLFSFFLIPIPYILEATACFSDYI